ncbi:MAG TPA: DUF1080 domain-containing protein [Planctomycetaceae bacterium]|nr:DUF1080 domain-containing protein [Planctomycetaceae bacterium]
MTAAFHSPSSRQTFIQRTLASFLTTLSLLGISVAWAESTLGDDAVKADSKTEKLKSLFDGKTLDGWDGDPKLWSVVDGVIHGQTTKENPAKGNTFLIWKGGEPKDFELRLSFRCSRENNSGIQYRSERVKEGVKNEWVVKGYQHEIRNNDEFPNVAGFIYGERLGRGRICLVGEKATATGPKKRNITEKLITQEEFKKLVKLDDWNDVVIVAKGRNIKHYFNGKLILDFTDTEKDARLGGVIALQLHGGVPMWAEFKDIKMKEL